MVAIIFSPTVSVLKNRCKVARRSDDFQSSGILLYFKKLGANPANRCYSLFPWLLSELKMTGLIKILDHPEIAKLVWITDLHSSFFKNKWKKSIFNIFNLPKWRKKIMRAIYISDTPLIHVMYKILILKGKLTFLSYQFLICNRWQRI